MRYWDEGIILCHSATGSTKANHKYISRYMKNGKWRYTYKNTSSSNSEDNSGHSDDEIVDLGPYKITYGELKAQEKALKESQKKSKKTTSKTKSSNSIIDSIKAYKKKVSASAAKHQPTKGENTRIAAFAKADAGKNYSKTKKKTTSSNTKAKKAFASASARLGTDNDWRYTSDGKVTKESKKVK